MSNLSAFLHPELTEQKSIIISTRFKNENGETEAFIIKPLTQEENDALIKKCTVVRRDRTGADKRIFDSTRYTHEVVCEGTVFPDFHSKEMCDRWGVADPIMVAPKMMLAGEFQKLADEIAVLSGIGTDAEEEAKN